MEHNRIMGNIKNKAESITKSDSKNKDNPATRYNEDFRQRAVNLYNEQLKSSTNQHGLRARIARELGIADPTLRDWILKADARDATINSLNETEAAERIKKLEKENADLRRDFEIVKAASTFFARELDPRT